MHQQRSKTESHVILPCLSEDKKRFKSKSIKDFDIRITNDKMPDYNPFKDKYLDEFFQKETRQKVAVSSKIGLVKDSKGNVVNRLEIKDTQNLVKIRKNPYIINK